MDSMASVGPLLPLVRRHVLHMAAKLGGKLQFGPMDSPYGRFAALIDPQGAAFAVIDLSKPQGEMPALVD